MRGRRRTARNDGSMRLSYPGRLRCQQGVLRMRFRGAIIATAVFATPVVAMAQPLTGFYVGAGAGLHIPQNPNITPLAPGYGTGRVQLNEGYGFNSNLAVGYGIGNGFRFEIEGNFARSNDRSVLGTPFPTASSGTTRTF